MIRNIFLISAAVWNVCVFVLYGIDKRKAKKGSRRIRESTLILTAFLLGGYGAICGMVLFNHKTSKPCFRYSVPAAFLINTAIFLMIFLIY